MRYTQYINCIQMIQQGRNFRLGCVLQDMGQLSQGRALIEEGESHSSIAGSSQRLGTSFQVKTAIMSGSCSGADNFRSTFQKMISTYFWARAQHRIQLKRGFDKFRRTILEAGRRWARDRTWWYPEVTMPQSVKIVQGGRSIPEQRRKAHHLS